jgi:hypothetical protein
MTPIGLLQTLEEKGVSFTISGERLKVDAPAGVLTPELRDAIADNKTSLMDLVLQRHIDSAQSPTVVMDSASPPLADRARWGATLDAEITRCRAERDRLAARWNMGFDYLDALAERAGQDAPESIRLFAEWERIDAAYQAAEDRLASLELTREIRGDLESRLSHPGAMQVSIGAQQVNVAQSADPKQSAPSAPVIGNAKDQITNG